jgi:NAD(P)-dependent dehydrogenase (short-subunit alcohol dehydrogenase family)
MTTAMGTGSSIGPMPDRVCVVTGATAGLGRITAEALAGQGATVVLVGRDPERCTRAQREIRAATGNDRVDWLAADLSSQRSIHTLAEDLKRRYDRLHVLVNNAGAIFQRRQQSADGIEMTLALNHLGYFLLTDLVLDLLKASAPARIVNVSSSAHTRARLDLDDIQARRYRPYPVYARSKLANLLFTYELARRLDGSGVTVNALDPGLARTSFGTQGGLMARLGIRLVHLYYRRHSISPEQGARTSIYLASSPEVADVTGRYFFEQRETPSSPSSYDRAAAARLWELSERLTGRQVAAG